MYILPTNENPSRAAISETSQKSHSTVHSPKPIYIAPTLMICSVDVTPGLGSIVFEYPHLGLHVYDFVLSSAPYIVQHNPCRCTPIDQKCIHPEVKTSRSAVHMESK